MPLSMDPRLYMIILFHNFSQNRRLARPHPRRLGPLLHRASLLPGGPHPRMPLKEELRDLKACAGPDEKCCKP